MPPLAAVVATLRDEGHVTGEGKLRGPLMGARSRGPRCSTVQKREKKKNDLAGGGSMVHNVSAPNQRRELARVEGRGVSIVFCQCTDRLALKCSSANSLGKDSPGVIGRWRQRLCRRRSNCAVDACSASAAYGYRRSGAADYLKLNVDIGQETPRMPMRPTRATAVFDLDMRRCHRARHRVTADLTRPPLQRTSILVPRLVRSESPS